MLSDELPITPERKRITISVWMLGDSEAPNAKASRWASGWSGQKGSAWGGRLTRVAEIRANVDGPHSEQVGQWAKQKRTQRKAKAAGGCERGNVGEKRWQTHTNSATPRRTTAGGARQSERQSPARAGRPTFIRRPKMRLDVRGGRRLQGLEVSRGPAPALARLSHRPLS